MESGSRPTSGGGRISKEGVKKELDPKVVNPRTEENWGEFASEHRLPIKFCSGHFHHFNLFANDRIGLVVKFRADERILKAGDINRSAVHPADHTFEEVNFFICAIVDAFKISSTPQWPVHRTRANS